MIPKRKDEIEDKIKRFYVFAPSSVYLELQKEAYKREVDLWTLCGCVLSAWLDSGCPDSFVSPRPSSSPIAKPD